MIVSVIETALVTCHLDATKLRGQAYDGVSNMSGQYNGCTTLIQQKHITHIHLGVYVYIYTNLGVYESRTWFEQKWIHSGLNIIEWL